MNIQKKVLEIISTFSFMDAKPIRKEDVLQYIGFDSFTTVELIITLEDDFGILFDDSDLDPAQLKTVDDVIALVQKNVLRGGKNVGIHKEKND